jgi:hypothetical protein
MFVSLEKLATLPGIPNRRTLGLLIQRNPDFPIVERGKRGRPYLIDYDQARAFIAALRAHPSLTNAEREDLARRLGLQFVGSQSNQKGFLDAR